MKKIWLFVTSVSILIMIFSNPEEVLPSIIKAGENAVNLSIKLLGIYAVWLGFLGILDETKLSEKIASLLSPFIDFLFGKEIDSETRKYLSINISTNILGIGNASTPMGIKAMQGLDKLNKSETASKQMIMLLVINATSLQLLPTTIIGLRSSLNSLNSSDIILPSIIATTTTTILGILLVKLFSKYQNAKFLRKKAIKIKK